MMIPDNTYVRLALGSALAGALGLIGLGVRRGAPLLFYAVVKRAVQSEFAFELSRSSKTAESVANMEPSIEQLVRGQIEMKADVREIRDIMRDFAQQLGQVQGVKAGELPTLIDRARERTA